jgi:hypothetical protein
MDDIASAIDGQTSAEKRLLPIAHRKLCATEKESDNYNFAVRKLRTKNENLFSTDSSYLEDIRFNNDLKSLSNTNETRPGTGRRASQVGQLAGCHGSPVP